MSDSTSPFCIQLEKGKGKKRIVTDSDGVRCAVCGVRCAVRMILRGTMGRRGQEPR